MRNDPVLFSFIGIVQKHLGRGKKMGYPTANIPVAADMPEGIYVGYSYLADRKLPSLVFIGSPLTFGETDKKAEVYILNFDEDIYGEEIRVESLKKIRDNMKFESESVLISQIAEDERIARAYFDNNHV